MHSADIQKSQAFIDEKQKFLILPHANVDPDGISSALAIYHLLKSIGKDCTVICPDALPSSLAFLPGYAALEEEFTATQDFVIHLNLSGGAEVDTLRYTTDDDAINIIIRPKSGSIRKGDVTFDQGSFGYDGIIIVDTAELSLLGSIYEENKTFFEKTPMLNIDHHVSNSKYGNVQLINSKASSATEVLFDLFNSVPQWKKNITPDIATLLLTGLITDTRSFQNPNTTPRSLEVASELLDLGARQQEIIKYIYKTKPLSTLKIWGRALNRIQTNPKAKIVWSSISKQDLNEMEATSKETHGIIDELLTTIPDADMYILFTEIEDGGLKASMRTTDAIDASALTGKLFGGGGHARAAGFRIKDIDNFDMAILEAVQKIITECTQKEPPKIATITSKKPIQPTQETPIERPIEKSENIDVLEELVEEGGKDE